MSDEPVSICPSCGQKRVRRLIGGAGLIFKGSGFYATDYARKKQTGEEPKAPSKKSTNGQSTSGGKTPSPAGGDD